MSRRNHLRVAAAAGLTALTIAGLPLAALADGTLSGQTCCDPGGAKVTAYADFTGRYSVTVKQIQLTDMCPGDGNSVYIEFQYQQSGGDWVTRGDKRENHGGCGVTQNETAYNFTATSGYINAVRLKVCVDETWPNNDDCQYTNYRYNQYV